MTTASSPLSLADVKPKAELHGIVKKIGLAGAFVDVGLDREAFLHISQIKGKKIKNVEDVLNQGQEVTVWVQSIDPVSGRLVVSMFKPPALEWGELAEGQIYTGRVVRLEKFGVFVDFGSEKAGLVHVSELDSGYVSSPDDVVKQGDEVRVKVIRVNREKGQIDLSMKSLVEIAEDVPSEAEEAPTAMAMAIQKALKGGKPESEELSAVSKKSQQDRSKFDDIFRRTLELQQKD